MGYGKTKYKNNNIDSKNVVEKKDKKFIDFAYMSCTNNKGNLVPTESHFHILCPKPFHGLVIDIGEEEVLLPRKSRFLINDIIERKNGSKVITMTMFRQKI